jgi:hypothetical protein
VALVFKELERAIKEVKNKITVLPDDDISGMREEEQMKLALLLEMDDHMRGFHWLSGDKAKEKIKAVLKSTYNYSQVAKDYETTVESLKASVSRASRLLEKRLGGKDAIEKILKGSKTSVKTSLTHFKVSSGTLDPEALLLPDLLAKLPKGEEDSSISIIDCEKELRLLKYFAHKNIDSVISRVNESKLALLRLVLDRGSNYEYERALLFQFFEEDITLEYLLEQIKETNTYSDITVKRREVNVSAE